MKVVPKGCVVIRVLEEVPRYQMLFCSKVWANDDTDVTADKKEEPSNSCGSLISLPEINIKRQVFLKKENISVE